MLLRMSHSQQCNTNYDLLFSILFLFLVPLLVYHLDHDLNWISDSLQSLKIKGILINRVHKGRKHNSRGKQKYLKSYTGILTNSTTVFSLWRLINSFDTHGSSRCFDKLFLCIRWTFWSFLFSSIVKCNGFSFYCRLKSKISNSL